MVSLKWLHKMNKNGPDHIGAIFSVKLFKHRPTLPASVSDEGVLGKAIKFISIAF